MSETPGQASAPTDASPHAAQEAAASASGAPGSPEALFDALVRDAYGDLCDLAFRLTRRRADAEDAVQDVLAAVWRRRDELLRDPSRAVDLRRYLQVAVRNRVRHQVARSATAARHDGHTRDARDGTAAASPSAEAILEARELRRELQAAVAQLPAQQRAVLLLRRFGELSTAEVADTLGVSLKTVENHLGRAMQRLRELLFRDTDA